MATDNGTAYRPSEVSPPGETLREILDERGISQNELARRMGRPQKTISEIINGKAQITPETALQLELVLGVPASFWNARESRFREFIARQEQERQLASEWSWAASFPLKELVKRRLIVDEKDRSAIVHQLLQFLGVSAPSQWEAVYQECQLAFRHSSKFDSDKTALACWLRAGVVRGAAIECAEYDRDRFLVVLAEARQLTRAEPEVFQVKLTELCASAGVALAFVPEFNRVRASGATRWLSPKKALIQLCLRYKTNDHLWFTFFHEAAHILLHAKKLIFLDNGRGSSELEDEANRWAGDYLIPPSEYQRFKSEGEFTAEATRAFAERIQIAPGIVVGRLQHDKEIGFNEMNALKLRLKWVEEAA